MRHTYTQSLKQRITIISILLCALVPPSAIATGPCLAAPPLRIILLESFDVPAVLEHTRFFLNAMGKLGYPADQIQILKAQGDPAIADRLLRSAIDRQRPDVIVSSATLASKVAYTIAKASTIPMVFFVVSDPVGAGIISELDAPSNDIVSGIVHGVSRDTKVEIVMRILKPLKPAGRPFRFGYIHSSYPSGVGDLALLRTVAARRGDLELISYQIPYNEKLFNAPQTMRYLKAGIEKLDPQIDFWWISQDPVGEDDVCLQTIAKYSHHPIVCGTNTASTKNGALVYIMADAGVGSRETAEIVDQVLKGTPVGTIPVHAPSKIVFGVNVSTAIRMEVAIPSDLLELAGPEIFR
jgi:putative ABC transport system substrate-binding protein